MSEKRLWEIDHPYYGAEGQFVEFESLAELVENVRITDADLNHVYRWDWQRADPSDYAEDEDVPGDSLTLFLVMPRRSLLVSWSAPVTEADEEKVREFLASDRVLGALKTMWEPLL